MAPVLLAELQTSTRHASLNAGGKLGPYSHVTGPMTEARPRAGSGRGCRWQAAQPGPASLQAPESLVKHRPRLSDTHAGCGARGDPGSAAQKPWGPAFLTFTREGYQPHSRTSSRLCYPVLSPRSKNLTHSLRAFWCFFLEGLPSHPALSLSRRACHMFIKNTQKRLFCSWD